MKARAARVTAACLAAALVACAFIPVKRDESPRAYADRALPEGADPFPNWPLDPDRAEDFILLRGYRVESVGLVGHGVTGAEKVTLHFLKADVTVDFKWKEMKSAWNPFYGRLDRSNNSPRKEIAAWKLQHLFLDSEDYVVPLSLAFAVPLELYQSGSRPTLANTNSALGVLSVWLKDVTLPDPLLDSERFNRDYLYARYLADFNLFTYLTKHNDGRMGNILVSKDDSRRQVFAIDNGIAFGAFFFNWFVPNWSQIRVPALRKESIDRLRGLREEDLHELLGVVAQLELDADGVYANVPASENLDADDGVRIEDNVVQLGLNEDEIENIWERIEDLIEAIDDGDIAVF